jgi:HD-like signal output (HDOD) protein/ActR/RegA family two-component response regulator
MSKRILFVDDEENVRSSLRRTFFDTDYETLFASGGQAGLDIIRNERVDMVVSDMRMPGMDGYSFLKIVREEKPLIIRIILSGYAEKQTLLKAIVDGTAKAYIPKPWNNDALKNEIAKLFAVYDTIRQKGLLDIISKIGRMPLLPESYYKIISLIEQDSNIDVIAEFIARDPSYAVKLLTIVNSSFFGVKIGSVKQAIVYLGLDTVKNIVLSSEVFELFMATDPHKEQVDIIWEHSKLTSKIFHRIYFLAHMKRVPEEYASAGLLHDLGRLLMLRYLPSEYFRVLETVKEDPQQSLLEAESKILGIVHTHLGGYLLDWWNLPSYLIETCLYHHTPLDPAVNTKEIIALCHIADILSWQLLDKNRGLAVIDLRVFDIAGITQEQCTACLKELSQEAGTE